MKGARSGRASTLALVVGAVVLSACAGENLFFAPGTSGEVEPTVEITAPTEGFTIALGDSILVTAQANAPNGGAGVVFRGTYTDGSAAYVERTGNMNGVQAATLTNYLQPAPGQVAGTPYIVVEVTGVGGDVGLDSVRVTIN
jgi:hypothetical protein